MIRTLGRNAQDIFGASMALLLSMFVLGVFLRAAAKWAPDNIADVIVDVASTAGYDFEERDGLYGNN